MTSPEIFLKDEKKYFNFFSESNVFSPFFLFKSKDLKESFSVEEKFFWGHNFLHEVMKNIFNWDPNIKFFVNGKFFNCLNRVSFKILKNIFLKYLDSAVIWYQISSLLYVSFELRYLKLNQSYLI